MFQPFTASPTAATSPATKNPISIAASVSPLLPEAERNYLTAGLGYRAGPLALDLGYQHIHQSDRRGRTRGRTSFAQTPQQLNVGVYHVDAHVLNATLAYHFGGRR